MKNYSKPRIALVCVVLVLNCLSYQNARAENPQQSSTVNFFKPCVSEEDSCIESIAAELPSGKIINGVLSNRIDSTPLSEIDSYLKLLRGPVAEWQFPGLTFQNGSDRMVLYSYYWPPGNVHCWNDGNCSSNEEELGIYLRPSNKDGMRPSVQVTGRNAEIICPNSPVNCNIGSPPWMIDTEVTFTIKLHTPIDFSPQYTHGRIKDLLITTDSLEGKKNYKLLNVSFSPLKLQNVYFALPNPGVIDNGLYVSDEPAMWIYGARNSKPLSIGPCVKSGGLQVTTNAYYMWNPTWNAGTSSIDVKLQSTHFDVDGSPSKGILQVRVSTKMAQCLWSVDLNGNIKAEFAITYEDGSKPEVISILGNVKDEFFNLTAANFHFSSPTVKLSLVQEENKKSSQNDSKISIRCVKGKVTKKVTGFNPKCPAGYKKKA